MRAVLIAAAIVSISIHTPPVRQAPQAPPRDVPVATASGHASIKGTVVSDDVSQTPIRRVIVTLSRAGISDSRIVASDDQGKYRFDDLPPGVYTLNASKGGFLSTNYGAPRPGLAGSAIPIAADQQFTAEPVALMRGGVIAGRLTNREGKPVALTNVFATQFRLVDGERGRSTTPGASGSVATDAHGNYRIYGLAPGDYVVSATALESLAGNSRQDTTPADIEWARQQSQGSITPGIASPSTGTPPSAPKLYSYAPTYYPGTADPSATTVLSLRAGEEKTGIDLTLQNVPVVRVSGVVTGPDGQAMANVIVQRTFKTNTPLLVRPSQGNLTTSAQDGRFVFGGVAPGDYMLMVRMSAPGAPAGSPLLWSRVDVTVNGGDVNDLALHLQPLPLVSGNVRFDGGTPPTPAELKGLQLLLVNVGREPARFGTLTAAVTSASTFGFTGTPPGPYLLRTITASGPDNSRWVLKSATAGGRDVLDSPFDVSLGHDIGDLVVTMSDQRVELSGTLVDANGQPTPQFYLLAFPTDTRDWSANSRRIRSTRADIAGHYRLVDLPPGEYFLCALTELDPNEQFDREYLQLLSAASMRLSLQDGEKRTLTLKVGGR